MGDLNFNGILELLSLIYKTDGLYPFLFVVLLMIIAIVIYKYSELIINKFLLKKKSVKINLKEHIIFSKIESLINHVIKSMHINCPLRNKVFKKILIIRFQIMLKLLKEQSEIPNDVESDVLKLSWETFFAKLENEWYDEVIRIGVPKIVITKYYEFRKGFTAILSDTVGTLCYKENTLEAMSFIFDIINGMEVASLPITYKTVDDLNGELSSIEFEGTKCCQCDVQCKYKVKKVVHHAS